MKTRWMAGAIGGLIGLTLAGCEPGDSEEAGSEESSQRVVVTIEGAMIGPTKAGGDSWDFDGAGLDANSKAQLAKALIGSNPYAEAAAILSGPIVQTVSKPDPYGKATLEGAGLEGMERVLAAKEEAVQDTFTPIWPHRAEWTGVRLNRDVRIRLELKDDDLFEDDPIGVAILNTDHLRAALEAKTVYHVEVADQTQNQILFVDIAVRPE